MYFTHATNLIYFQIVHLNINKNGVRHVMAHMSQNVTCVSDLHYYLYAKFTQKENE